MRCVIPGPLPADARSMMRHFGYAEHHTHGMGLTFIRKAHEAQFPRFHALVRQTVDGGLLLNIHLDQASLGGEGNHRYVWAYRNPHLDEEMKRIMAIVVKKRTVIAEPRAFVPEKMGFIGKLFRLM
jgi:hypothetical protein